PATSPSRQSSKQVRQLTCRFSSRKAKRSRSIHAPARTWAARDRVWFRAAQAAGLWFPAACRKPVDKVVCALSEASQQAAEMNRPAACVPQKLQISLFQIHRILRNLRAIWRRNANRKRTAVRAIPGAAGKLSVALRAQDREALSQNPSRSLCRRNG